MQPAADPDRESSGETPAEEIAVRIAKPADLEFILALCRRVFLQFGSYDRYVQDWFGEERVETYLAEKGGRPAGFFMLIIHRAEDASSHGVGELLAIAVVPELQSQGVGTALLELCLSLVRDPSLGVGEVRLSVAEGNARAQRMFARRGFRIGPATGIYPAGQRALFMTKNLKPLNQENAR